ncbi:thiamine phosphate synthase [Neobacillus mesonae]|nr:thiamine phosphate synthase [Neobacillus mesonae]
MHSYLAWSIRTVERGREIISERRMLEFHVISSTKVPYKAWIEIFSEIWPYVTAMHIRDRERTRMEIERFIGSLTQNHVPLSKIGLNRQVSLTHKYAVGTHQIGMEELNQIKLERQHSNRNSPLRLGVSVHSLQEAKQAEFQGAGFLIYGHIYDSSSKPGAAPRGIDSLRKICYEVSVPVIAIGGVQPENVGELIEAGASGIAIISGVINSEDPLAAMFAYRKELLRYGTIK